jgi:hypothetical protein
MLWIIFNLYPALERDTSCHGNLNCLTEHEWKGVLQTTYDIECGRILREFEIVRYEKCLNKDSLCMQSLK